MNTTLPGTDMGPVPDKATTKKGECKTFSEVVQES